MPKDKYCLMAAQRMPLNCNCLIRQSCDGSLLYVYATDPYYMYMQRILIICICDGSLLYVYATDPYYMYMQRILLHVYATDPYYMYMRRILIRVLISSLRR